MRRISTDPAPPPTKIHGHIDIRILLSGSNTQNGPRPPPPPPKKKKKKKKKKIQGHIDIGILLSGSKAQSEEAFRNLKDPDVYMWPGRCAWDSNGLSARSLWSLLYWVAAKEFSILLPSERRILCFSRCLSYGKLHRIPESGDEW